MHCEDSCDHQCMNKHVMWCIPYQIPYWSTSRTAIQAEIINRTLTFSINVFSICLNFTINDDNLALEAPEEYNLVLLQPEEPQLQLERNSTRIIITDDDGTQTMHTISQLVGSKTWMNNSKIFTLVWQAYRVRFWQSYIFASHSFFIYSILWNLDKYRRVIFFTVCSCDCWIQPNWVQHQWECWSGHTDGWKEGSHSWAPYSQHLDKWPHQYW